MINRNENRQFQVGSGTGAPSIMLPLAFLLAGLVALLVGAVWLVARPSILASYHYNQYVIAVTHLIVLGFLCSVVMGAMYQIVPVALERALQRTPGALAIHFFISRVWSAWSGCFGNGT